MERLELWLLRCLGSFLGLAVMGCGGGATPAYGAIPTYGSPTATYKVDGTVTDSATGLPIPGIQVTYMGGKGLSGTDGRFSLTVTSNYCTVCQAVADDVDGAANGTYGEAAVALNLVQTAPGDGKWFFGTFEQSGVAIKMVPKP